MRVRSWILCCVGLLPLPGFAETPPDFSGEWVLSGNAPDGDGSKPADSQNPGSHSGMGGRGGGMGGHGGGGGMGGGHHGRQAQNAPGNPDSAAANASANPRLNARELIIRQSEVVFDVAANGQRMAYRFDNRNNYGAPYGGTVQLTWATPEMVIETHPDAGGSIEEHYKLSDDGKKLSLLMRVQAAGSDSVREIRRVFVRNTGDASTTLPP